MTTVWRDRSTAVSAWLAVGAVTTLNGTCAAKSKVREVLDKSLTIRARYAECLFPWKEDNQPDCAFATQE
jgi:hypothetical protein